MTVSLTSKDTIRVAVITGQHTFDVPGFCRMFHSIPGLEFYPQDLDNYLADEGQVRPWYDVLFFYNFHREPPSEDTLALGETEPGIFVLHHALLAFPQWQVWSDICGIQDRSFGYHPEQTVRIEVVNIEHPITQGLPAWEMVDETYTMNDVGEDSDILLATDHPKSMHTLAWTRQHKGTRVFCLALGHDNRAYANSRFRTVVARGIRWVARRV